MRKLAVPLLCAVVLLAGCSKSEPQQEQVFGSSDSSAPQNKFGLAEAIQAPSILPNLASKPSGQTNIDLPRQPDAQKAATPDSAIPINLPKIAYSYSYAYRLDGDRIPALQRKHADLCEAQGAAVCRIVNLEQNGMEGELARGDLQLQVATSRARAFGTELAKVVGQAGGKEIATAISGEDLSKKIVDTAARLRSREVLRDRLMEVLAARKGTVAELIEAERGVAAVNEEIDEAKSWLAEMQGRIEFSDVRIRYVSEEATFQAAEQGNAFTTPVNVAISSIGGILGLIVAAVIMLATIAIPIGLLVWAGRWLWRRGRRRAQSVKNSEPTALTSQSEENAPVSP